MTHERVGESESSIVHETLPTAFRLLDDGRVLVQAGDHAGIILDSESGNVVIYGKSIDFLAKDLKVDGIPIDKQGIISRTKQKAKDMFSSNRLKEGLRGRKDV